MAKGFKDKGKFRPTEKTSTRISSSQVKTENPSTMEDIMRSAELKSRRIVEEKQPELIKNATGFIRAGSFMGGDTHWIRFEKVKVGDKIFDTKTRYHWTDPDYPHQEDVETAMEVSEKDEPEKDPKTNWINHLNYDDQEFTFNLDGIMIIDDGRIDGLPNISLGRIDVKDLQTDEEFRGLN